MPDVQSRIVGQCVVDRSRKLRRPAQHLAFASNAIALAALLCGIPAVAQSTGPLVMVSVAQQVDLIEEVPLTGSVVSPRVAQLSTEVSGIVETMAVEIGDQLRAGDEILQLNAELDALSLAATRAVTDQAIQELEDAKRRLANAKALAERHSVSANEIESLAAEVRIDTAGVKRFRAEQQRQAARIQRHKLSAPFAGVISRKLVEQGEWIQPGDTVVELTASTGLRIDFRAPQSVYNKLDETSEIRITLDALPGQTFDCTIEAIIPVVDPTTRTFLIRTAPDDSKVKLAPGMSASAVLRLNTDTEGVVVPRDALTRYPDGRVTVWVVDQEGEQATVSEHPVQIGAGFNGKVAVTSGLSPDTLVVVQGNEALREKQRVTIKRAE